MTQDEKAKYQSADELREIFVKIKGKKFRLDCGHHVTIGHNLGNNLIIYNNKKPTIICTCCGY
jgi:hypothetical protein